MARDPYAIPAIGTIERRNFRDDFAPGPREQSELEMLREFYDRITRAEEKSRTLDELNQRVCEVIAWAKRKRGE